MTIGGKRYEGRAENLKVWDISVAFSGLTKKDRIQLLLGCIREGTERLPRRICFKVDKAWSTFRKYSFLEVKIDADHREAIFVC